MTKLSHFDASGQAHMVDIANKDETKRTAIATGSITMSAEAFQLLEFNASRKGDVLGIARIAAIQGTKITANLIPLCHPLALTHVHVDFVKDEENHCLSIIVTTETVGKTGVEMEALSGVSAGLLTVYDMLKAIEKNMVISNIHLIQKKGGKSGEFNF
ncbi:Molybdenum cofactor biosynthesis enzyme MoaC (MoaC) (PDB:1EKR) (PUBMED:32239579) [Commensalibacter communis]|uniref:Cyclic pyranopterin monophosphate synthase n=1 Tax=Commensalibacter communis TaxID=2972786 RepID=A0A9W4TND6_9PROT|nr:cyclic pyranopterin monophosphate synthase MoaC [Commensalibacter communis]CAI3936075.1 Molybdenum cofactor biosynthesis enzyme MoaC (MoaC) (PDB:1EKR) (PUBMED:32239579) [Commensalibacter communis]CAI3938000.1 Molybdenum cofactor biosynthesis enzyme MoaC (MoaC) (PDB:1EKR) (PUBMED:32239579) [Commensalibacter communis]CAI3942081.1 Molybdenum cofactor biosynthesis enzyme MoaC (MoaC) (PDB:1EKR) (PUBMED:32239579) [Commensalibacter communis]CAI3942138.1 Molybdenum cofactor biosynthesis enzyme MoaC 